jgi:hypothetical protein
MRYSDSTSLDVHLAWSSESTVEVVELARGRMLVEKGVLEWYPYLGTAALIVHLYTIIDLLRLLPDESLTNVIISMTNVMELWNL